MTHCTDANESEIGDAIVESAIDREKFFITSKLWLTKFRPELVESAFQETIKVPPFILNKLHL